MCMSGTVGVGSFGWTFRPSANGPRSQPSMPAPPAPVFAAATMLGRCRNSCHRLDTHAYRSRSWGCSCAGKAPSSPYVLALCNGRWPVCQAKATLRSAASVRSSNRLNGLKTSRTCFSEMPTDSCRSICSVMPFPQACVVNRLITLVRRPVGHGSLSSDTWARKRYVEHPSRPGLCSRISMSTTGRI